MMTDRLPSKHIVLLGVGHTNAHIVRMWGMHALPDTSLTCISDNPIATYSGMLPAVLAGQIPPERMQIDLVRLCSSVGANLIVGKATGIDFETNEIQMHSRPPVAFDALSIGIGSVPSTNDSDLESERVVKIKPMQGFLARLGTAMKKVQAQGSTTPLQVLVVGSGIAGIEILFCLPEYLRSVSEREFSLTLATRSEQVLSAVTDSMRKRVEREISNRSITLKTSVSVTKIRDEHVTFSDGSADEFDLVIWATGAVAPPALSQFELPLDDRGFLATDATLRSTSGNPVFAVGDTGTIEGIPLAKAGVFAVRQGPILWQNLDRLLNNRSLIKYVPQTSFMKLINKGDGTAIGEWKGFAFEGGWVMRMKDRIDSRFMDKYQPKPMVSDEPMQCRGCGCKLGADVLDSALGFEANHLELDDATDIGDDEDKLIASTDFFTSPVSDPYLAGKIAALHSASDIIASGARVTQALANVVVPEGDTRSQRKHLSDFMFGAREEFAAMGASIVGGHTIVGPRFEAGFSVIGKPYDDRRLRKRNLRLGDHLVLTKPLGIGILLAAHMRSECSADDYQQLIACICERQHTLAEIAIQCGIDAGTDVTGFGLVGHLLEMLDASELAAELLLDTIPVLSGVEEAVEKGIVSSLAPQNLMTSSRVRSKFKDRAKYQALFDPQTCGGLLLGIPGDRVDEFTSRAVQENLTPPTTIGRVIAEESDTHRIELK